MSQQQKVILKTTKKYGKGVFAARRIRKGERVAVFDGEFYDLKFKNWTREILNHVIQVGTGKWRDSKGIARYLNHSCKPNCGVRGLYNIVAMRTIEKGEEITWDYEMTERNIWGWQMRCRCGATECRKVIGNYNNMPSATREKYKGFISLWLRRDTTKVW